MTPERKTMQRLGKGDERPAALEVRAGAFLGEARHTTGLSDAVVGAIERRLVHRESVRRGVRLMPALAAIAVLLAAGSAIALVDGWRPRLPFIDRKPSPSPARPKTALPTASAVRAANPTPVAAQSAPSPELAPVLKTRGTVVARRWLRQEPVLPPAPQLSEGAATEAPVSAEARSLSDALARWRRDGNAEAALTLLSAHERSFRDGALSVEARVARAEILLAIGRRAEALVVLDSLSLASLPRSRELHTLRGELRAQAGRCREAHVDLSAVMLNTATDVLGQRAARALAKCP